MRLASTLRFRFLIGKMTERSKKIVLGLTGGIACGKSTALKVFNNLGWASISTDQVVEDLMKWDDEVISWFKPLGK